MPDDFPLPHYAMPPGTAGPTPKGIPIPERPDKMAKGIVKIAKMPQLNRAIRHLKTKRLKRFF